MRLGNGVIGRPLDRRINSATAKKLSGTQSLGGGSSDCPLVPLTPIKKPLDLKFAPNSLKMD